VLARVRPGGGEYGQGVLLAAREGDGEDGAAEALLPRSGMNFSHVRSERAASSAFRRAAFTAAPAGPFQRLASSGAGAPGSAPLSRVNVASVLPEVMRTAVMSGRLKESTVLSRSSSGPPVKRKRKLSRAW